MSRHTTHNSRAHFLAQTTPLPQSHPPRYNQGGGRYGGAVGGGSGNVRLRPSGLPPARRPVSPPKYELTRSNFPAALGVAEIGAKNTHTPINATQTAGSSAAPPLDFSASSVTAAPEEEEVDLSPPALAPLGPTEQQLYNRGAQRSIDGMVRRWRKYANEYDSIHGPGGYAEAYGVAWGSGTVRRHHTDEWDAVENTA